MSWGMPQDERRFGGLPKRWVIIIAALFLVSSTFAINITIKADLTPLVEKRPSVLYWVIQPGADVGGIGAGVVRMVRTWDEWLIIWGYDINQPAPELTDEAVTEIVRNLVGVPDLAVEVTGSSLWGINEMYATHLQNGRVLCGGDAIHRHPPSNGLGSNTSVQDSYNLAWKLAAVIRGYAGPELLETYSDERAPVAKQIVLRANKSGAEFAEMFAALGIKPGATDAEMVASIAERKENTEAGRKKRAAIEKALELKNYEFNAHGVELGQFYQSGAVVSDGSKKPKPTRDPELYFEPSTVPGSPLPHVWLGDSMNKYSTLDLAPSTQFTVITGVSGQKWADAAQAIAARSNVPLVPLVIGPGEAVTDLYFDWARLREVDEDGVILVRPDKIVAWRSQSMVADPEKALREVLSKVLHKAL